MNTQRLTITSATMMGTAPAIDLAMLPNGTFEHMSQLLGDAGIRHNQGGISF
ncbi:MAG: hypothetical protein ABIP61_02635 [Burkholderiaceae bacterium]